MSGTGSPFFVEEYVRWSDVDAAGIINYGAYVRFFEAAETEMFRAAGLPWGEVFERFDIWLPRVRYSCEFHVPALLDERLRVGAFVKRLGNTSIRLGFTADKTNGSRAAEGEIVLVCVDRKTFKPRALPEELSTALSRFVV